MLVLKLYSYAIVTPVSRFWVLAILSDLKAGHVVLGKLTLGLRLAELAYQAI